MKVLSNSNYIIRKIGTLRTQCDQRMRLRQLSPTHQSKTSKKTQYFEDPDALNQQDLFDSNIPAPVIEQPQQVVPDQSEFEELHADHGII